MPAIEESCVVLDGPEANPHYEATLPLLVNLESFEPDLENPYMEH